MEDLEEEEEVEVEIVSKTEVTKTSRLPGTNHIQSSDSEEEFCDTSMDLEVTMMYEALSSQTRIYN